MRIGAATLGGKRINKLKENDKEKEHRARGGETEGGETQNKMRIKEREWLNKSIIRT